MVPCYSTHTTCAAHTIIVSSIPYVILHTRDPSTYDHHHGSILSPRTLLGIANPINCALWLWLHCLWCSRSNPLRRPLHNTPYHIPRAPSENHYTTRIHHRSSSISTYWVPTLLSFVKPFFAKVNVFLWKFIFLLWARMSFFVKSSFPGQDYRSSSREGASEYCDKWF